MKLSSTVPLVPQDAGCPSGCRSGGRETCSAQATATAGGREGDRVPGWQAGGRGGRRHDNSGGEVWRRMVGGSSGDTAASPPAPASPAAKRTASLHRPLCSCPRRAPAPAARVLLPPARGHPAAALEPRVMGYLGVGLLSLPLQEPELLLLLSEEVP